jgi:hypothetical protein
MVQSAKEMKVDVVLNVHDSSFCKDINDEIAELEKRGKASSNVKTDLFISIHNLIKDTIKSQKLSLDN